MTPVIFLLLSIIISFGAVRVGAVALELTGMPSSQAKLQSLSAFSNSRFTTRDSEEVTKHRARRRMTTAWLDKPYRLSESAHQDMLHLAEGRALTRFVVTANCPSLGHKLANMRLKDYTVRILAIERGTEFHPIPRGEDRIRAGDRLVVFGRRTAIEHLFEPEWMAALEVAETEALRISDPGTAPDPTEPS